MLDACLLAVLYLPDVGQDDWHGYDKAEIVSTLLIHDLPEAFAGDITWKHQTEESKRREHQVLASMGKMGSYVKPSDIFKFHQLYLGFESGAPLNARIAKEIDRIENLMQLYVYSRKTRIEDYDTWRKRLAETVETDAGKHVLAVVQALHYEGRRLRIC